MLDFSTQKQILEPLLKDPKNHVCADCDSIAPTWVSLDFGVFLCSNCSGAHRGLGPTITRVRSANLDKWQREWVDNMQVGNQQLNKYWQADSRAASRKPNSNSSLQDINRYVFEKYIKKKFVNDPSQPDPLTSYKNGTYQNSKKQTNTPVQSTFSKPTSQSKSVSQAKTTPVKQEVSLLEFDFEAPQQLISVRSETIQNPIPCIQEQEDEFTDFSEAGSAPPQDPLIDNFISFDALMNSHKQANSFAKPQLSAQGNHYMQHHNYAHDPHLQRHNSYTPHYNQSYQQPYVQYGMGYAQNNQGMMMPGQYGNWR